MDQESTTKKRKRSEFSVDVDHQKHQGDASATLKEESAENKVVGGGFGAIFGQILSNDLPEGKKEPILAKKARSRDAERVVKAQRERQVEKEAKLVKKQAQMIGLAESVRNDAKEKALKKTATKGVVLLFNAIRKHQKVENEVQEAPAKAKSRGDVAKAGFMEMLSRTTDTKKPEEPKWEVLGEDFPMLEEDSQSEPEPKKSWSDMDSSSSDED